MITPIGIHAEPRKNITKQKIKAKKSDYKPSRIALIRAKYVDVLKVLLLNDNISLLSLFSSAILCFHSYIAFAAT